MAGLRGAKGTFHAKMGTIKDRNGMELTEAEDIKKRWQEYTELYKKDLHENTKQHDSTEREQGNNSTSDPQRHPAASVRNTSL